MGEENTRLVSDYIFHCNGHSPTGEAAFHRLMSGFGWAKSPLLPRLGKLDNNGEISSSTEHKVLYDRELSRHDSIISVFSVSTSIIRLQQLDDPPD